MRRLSLPIALAFVLTACGGTGTESAETADSSSPTGAVSSAPAPAPDESAVPESSEASDDPGPSSSDASESPSFDGPPAPDFELILAGGETFTLSAEQKPVYMVFWAEW